MTKRLFISIVSISAIALGLVATTTPTFGQDAGTVNTTIKVAAPATPCITLGATSVDYGTQKFNVDGTTFMASVQGSTFTVASCSRGTEDILAAGDGCKGDDGPLGSLAHAQK